MGDCLLSFWGSDEVEIFSGSAEDGVEPCGAALGVLEELYFVDNEGIDWVVVVEHFDGGGGVGSGLVVICLQDNLFASDE